MKFMTICLWAFMAMPCFLFGQWKVIGVSGTDWHTAGHWSPVGIPTANDSVLVFGPAFIRPDSTARALHVSVDENGILEIQRDIPTNKPGRLIISNSPGNGILNEGIINNGGRITINQSGDNGIENKGALTVLDLAKIQIDSAVGDGLRDLGNATIDLSGSMSINNCGENGYYSFGDSTRIESTGEMTISQISERGIYYFGDYFNNQGKVSIDSSGHNGFYSSGKLINEDTIRVMNSGDNGFMNYDSLTNTASGYIEITNSGTNDDGYYNDEYTLNQGNLVISEIKDHGINTYYSFTNEGNISLINCNTGIITGGPFHNEGNFSILNGDVGIYIDDDGFFNNSASVSIDSSKEYGIYNDDSLYNDDGAYILIEGLFENNAVGIETDDSDDIFVNDGKLYIYDTDSSALINGGIIVNKDSIILERSDRTAFLNLDSMYNYNGVLLISISNGDDAGLTNESVESVIRNEGLINIENGEGPGLFNNLGLIINLDSLIINKVVDYGIDNAGILLNKSGAIVVDGVSKGAEMDNLKGNAWLKKEQLIEKGVGIRNRSLAISAKFTNDGNVGVSDIFYGVINLAEFINNDSISMGHCKTTGVNNSSSMSGFNTVFTNNSYLYVTGDKGIVTDADFTNSELGEVIIRCDDDDFFESVIPGVFISEGTLDIDFTNSGNGGN